MSKKFFRPPTQALSSDDEENDDSSADEQLQPPKPGVSANLSSSDDDEQEEEEEQPKKRPAPSSSRPSKRPKASAFLDLEAEASDDDDESVNEDAAGEGMDEETQALIRQQDRRRAQQGANWDKQSVSEITAGITERHRLGATRIPRSRLGDAAPVAARRQYTQSVADTPIYAQAVAQQSLVPSVQDPSLWMLSVPTGKEADLVMQLLNKLAAAARNSGQAPGICSAIAAQTRGKIYIEAFGEPAVKDAIQNVRGIMPSTMKLVPVKDMTTVMTVQPTKKPVQAGAWVRLQRGHYKGDLALVHSVKDSGLRCIVQFVPRIDWDASNLSLEEARFRRKTVRPPAALYNVQQAIAQGKTVDRQRFAGIDKTCDVFEGNYYLDGYCLKEMTINMIKPATDPPPSLDELQVFRKKDTDNDGSNSKSASNLLDELSQLQKDDKSKDEAIMLQIGDTVQVKEGDLVGVRGKITSLDGSTVKIYVQQAGGQVEFLQSQVAKYIAVGAHVKVLAGRYAHETGTVVAMDDWTAVVLTDVTNMEISVQTQQLRESAEIASGQDKLQGYELYDLVVLSGGGSANEVGVIVRVGREDFTVLNNHGLARTVRPEELRGKRNSTSQRAVALDVQGNQLRCGDTVTVAEGPHKGKSATIKRMSRSQLFLHSQTRTENAGILVVRSRSCVLSGASAQQRQAQNAESSPFATPVSQSTNRGGSSFANRKDDALLGKSVRVQAGQWKGYIGTVCDTTVTHVQIELHSRLKKVMVIRERVVVVGNQFGAIQENAGMEPPVVSVATVGGATPMHDGMGGGATPAIHAFEGGGDGGGTPGHDDQENADEVWRPGGAVDQDASKQDVWGAGGTYNEETNQWSGGGGGTTWDPAAASRQPDFKSEPHVKAEPGDKESPLWFVERARVRMLDTNKIGYIHQVLSESTAMVTLEDDKSQRQVTCSQVDRVLPQEKDSVLVISGSEVGLEGSLVCIDGDDAILQGANEEFKIIDCKLLVSIHAP